LRWGAPTWPPTPPQRYLETVEGPFGSDIDYAMLIKQYEGDNSSNAPPSGATARRSASASASRFTRLTNAFSKKVDNHKAAVALSFMHYNFVRIHKTLRVTPAMEAGVSDHVWGRTKSRG